jgi:enoyl-CoA hydratase/carnithine racemase
VSGALVEVRLSGLAAIVELRRGEKLNALSSALEAAIGDALDREDVRTAACMIFTGGPRAFSAGADVGELRDMDPAAILAYYRATGGVYERIARLPQPTISAIAGHCLGGGLELALATDFRIADTTASFGLPEVGIGILPSSGGTHRLVRLVGTARAKELILLGERFGADEAHRLGLVNEVAAEGTGLAHALELAERLAALPPVAVSVAKQVIDAMPDASYDAGLALERLAYGLLAQTDDHREATAAFADRREPRFRGR